MKTHWKILIVGVLSVVILIPIIHHYQLRVATEAYIAELKAKGEPMDLAQVIPMPASLEQNGVPFIINSLTNFGYKYQAIAETNPPLTMRGISPGRAMIGWQQEDIRSSDGTNDWEDLGRELTVAKQDFSSFQNLTNHPVLDFDLDFEKGIELLLPHLGPLKRTAQWLSASALYNLHLRKTADACDDLHILLLIIKGQTEERLEISQAVRIYLARIGVETTWEILQDPNVSEKDLAWLQAGWQSVEFIKPVEKAYLMERVMDMRSLDQYRKSPNELWRSISGRNGTGRMWRQNQWQWFWSYADEKRMLQTQSMLIEATRMAETNKSFQSITSFVHTNFERLHFEAPQSRDEESFRIDIDEFEVRWLFSEGAYNSFNILRRAMVMETTRNIVVTAIALKRYELRYHEFPAAIDQLAPVFLKATPIDWMDGQPLRYVRNADGSFRLYSVGENGKDDGGDPAPEKGTTNPNYSWQSVHALDWVWPQPATAAEIEAFYAHPPK